jgi:hypothetical protein
MNILIISGSPRKKGLVSQMLDIMREEAEQRGDNVQTVFTNDLNIKPCIGCMACRSKEKCVLGEDDSQRVLKMLQDADAIIMATNHRKIDRETAIFLNKVANLKLVYEEKSGGVDMCKALERRYQEKEVAGAIKMLKSDGVSDEDIIIKVTKLFGVTKEYVLTLLRAQVA